MDIRELLKIPKESRVVLAPVKTKHLETLLAVIHELTLHHADLHFVLKGAEKFQKKIPTHPKIHFHESDHLEGIDALLLTQEDKSFIDLTLKAFALKIPVVSIVGKEIQKLIIHSVTGLLAHPKDAGMLATHIENLIYIDGGIKEKIKLQASDSLLSPKT
ncbi:MAG: hypothetical protein K2P81_16540 [Bacteriovoracaceae bacterium]|nr:hypothetical protein [Bacteriovoracaceae bacterium]